MLLALTLLAIAHLPPVRARVAAFGVRLLHDRYGIDARIERLDYNLFALRGSVSGLEMAASVRATEPFLQADRVALDLGWPSVFGTIRVDDARIVNPHISLATDAQGRLNLPPALQQRDALGPRTNLDVRRIAISGLAIAVAETAHEIGLNVSDVSLSVVGTQGTLAGDLRADRPGLLRIGRRTIVITRLDARLSFDGALLRADAVNVSSPGGTFALRGAIGPFTGNAPIDGALTTRLDVSELARQFGRTARGTIAMAGTISGTIGTPRAALRVSSPGLAYASLSPAQLKSELRMTREAVTVDSFGIAASWAHLQARGRIAPHPPPRASCAPRGRAQTPARSHRRWARCRCACAHWSAATGGHPGQGSCPRGSRPVSSRARCRRLGPGCRSKAPPRCRSSAAHGP